MRNSQILSILIGYSVVALIYITFSDAVMFSVLQDAFETSTISIVKGWGFVVITAITLGWLLKRMRREENERYLAIVQNHNAIMLLIDPQSGRLVDANEAAARFYGWSVVALRKMRISEINTLDPDKINARMAEAAANHQHEFNFFHRRADGQIREVTVFAGPVYFEDRSLLLSIVHDVTEQRAAERSLLRLTRLYNFLSESNRLIASASSEHTLFDSICQSAIDQGGLQAAWVELLQPDQSARIETLAGTDPKNLAINPLTHLDDNKAFGGYRSFPICRGEQAIGTVNFHSTVLDEFTSEEHETMQQVAISISRGLDAIRQRDLLETTRDVVNASPVVLFRWKAQPGWPMSFVSENVKQWGYSAPALVSGQTGFDQIVHPEDLQKTIEAVDAYTQQKVSHFRQRYRIRTADAQTRWVDDDTRIIRQQDGQPAYYQGTLTDITHQVQVALDLEQRVKRQRAILDNAPDMVFINRGNKVTYVNPAGLRLLGAESADKVIGLSVFDLFHTDCHPAIRERISQLVSRPGTSVRAVVEKIVSFNGDNVDVEVTAVSYLSGDSLEIQVNCRDVRDRLAAENTIASYVSQLQRATFATTEAVSRMVEYRDPYTAGHERRVGVLAAAIANEMGFAEDFQRGLRVAGALHDVGKIIVPAEILSKPSKLSNAEFEIIKQHAQTGYEILKGIDFPWPVAAVAHQHHERLDGGGYPQGLTAADICIEAKITAIADVVESMTSHRPYRPGLGLDRALSEIEAGAGRIYDADVVTACLSLFRQKKYLLPD